MKLSLARRNPGQPIPPGDHLRSTAPIRRSPEVRTRVDGRRWSSEAYRPVHRSRRSRD